MRFLPHRPPLYYGWIITAALAITETVSWGIIYYAFSVFISPMETELGWSRAEMTGAFSLSLLVAGAMAFPIGSWIDRHGARWLMTLGSIAASLLVLAWSQVHSFAAFYLIWIGLGVCSAAVLYEPAFAVVTTWFTRRRSQALALVTLAAGLASTIFIPVSDALLHAFGWRDALVLMAIFLGLTTIPLHALILRRRPDDLGLLPDGEVKSESVPAAPPNTISLKQILHSRTFWLLAAGFSLSNLAADAIRVHFIPYLIDTGISASAAAWASGSIGVMQVLGRVLFAPLDMRLSNRVLLA
ncbi:MAG: MFS transporter, partial [Anaerolineae bacterium]|nr:MFS transporter [Anaerolineae bacterium]